MLMTDDIDPDANAQPHASLDIDSGTDRKRRRMQLESAGGHCARCPPHDGDNRKRRPRPDVYKSRRKGR